MTGKTLEFDTEEMIEALAAFMSLPVAPGDRADVAAHLAIARRIAGDLLEVELDDEAEPAPIFRA